MSGVGVGEATDTLSPVLPLLWASAWLAEPATSAMVVMAATITRARAVLMFSFPSLSAVVGRPLPLHVAPAVPALPPEVGG